MAEGEDWLMRPVMRGVLPYSFLDDPMRDLSDFVFVLEALDVQDENQMRMKRMLERS